MGKKLEQRCDKRVLEYVVEEKKHLRTGKRTKLPRLIGGSGACPRPFLFSPRGTSAALSPYHNILGCFFSSTTYSNTLLSRRFSSFLPIDYSFLV